MRVLFLYPNLYTQMGFNHGLATLSSVLKAAGHETRMVNLNENLPPVPDKDEIWNTVREWQPGLIGFSCLTMQYDSALEIARGLRERAAAEGCELPPIVVGGIHPTMVPELVMGDGVWDHVGIGECEDALTELVRRVEAGESAEDITNFLSWKDGARPERTEDATETNWVRNKVGEFPNFAELPEPDYELFDTQRITDQKHGWFGLMTSRGCPYRCTYCLNHKVMDLYKADLGRGVSNLGFLRYRPADRMIAEIRKVLARYENIGTFILDDDLFTMNPEHAIAFCEAYAASEIDVPFVVNSHVKQLDPRVAEALAKAGCRILKLGIESGSPRVRTQILERHMSQDDILGTVASSEKFNLHTSGFLMVGLPTETREERMESVNLLAEARIGRFRTSFFYPFPGTVGYDHTVKGGYASAEPDRDVASFTDGSILDFGPEENLFVDQLGTLMPWFVNARMSAYHDAPASVRYQPWVDKVLAMSADEWREFKPTVRQVDAKLSAQCVAAEELHYAIRYNQFMGVRSDFFLAEENGIEWFTAAAKPEGARLRDLALAAAASEAC